MRGEFEKIIGKKISAVYCRDNITSPKSQIFLVFDDDTHFEIYAQGEMKGAKGLDQGGLEKLLSLRQPRGTGVVFGDEYEPIFALNDDDRFMIKQADEAATYVLRNKDPTPSNIISLGKFLYALRRLPKVTEGSTYIDVSVGPVNFQISETRLSASIGGEDGIYALEWSVDIDGSREVEGDMSRFNGAFEEYLNLGWGAEIEDESELDGRVDGL